MDLDSHLHGVWKVGGEEMEGAEVSGLGRHRAGAGAKGMRVVRGNWGSVGLQRVETRGSTCSMLPRCDCAGEVQFRGRVGVTEFTG